MYRVHVVPQLCAGTSNCVEEAPDAFRMREDGLAALIHPDAPLDRLMRAAEACPMQAIHVYDSEGRRVFP